MAAESPEFALEAEDLAKNYGRREAVRGVTFAVRRGEFFGLLGPNGAGKTTTLGMFAGLVVPSRGGIRIAGRPAGQRSADAKRRLGLVPQDFAFYPTLSALDNLKFFGALYGLRGRPLRARIDAVLDIASLAGREDEPVAQFSGGMKRRLNIAIGLLHEPEILILDEPTVGVDAQSRGAILDTLQRLNRGGLTVIYSTHYMEEAQRLCGRVAILDQGRLVALDSPRDLVRSLAGGIVAVNFAVPVTPGLRQRLAAWTTSAGLEADPCSLRLAAPVPEDLLPRLLEAARQEQLAIRDLQVLEPGLETVFLKLTGRRLRD